MAADWTVEYEGEAFERFLDSLSKYEQAVLLAAIENVLQVYGPDICASEWGKTLGKGLYEFRVRKSLNAILSSVGLEREDDQKANTTVLIRVFCTFYGSKIILLHHGYNKKKAPSPKRQQREIARARKIHERWKQQTRP